MIVNFDEWKAIRKYLNNGSKIPPRVVCTSGGFDPIHPGHISCIQQSHELGDILVVVVNGDDFLTTKKGYAFMDLKARCRVVDALEGVDFTIPFPIENDPTVVEALRLIEPDVFAKGGDRHNIETIPEWDICQTNSIEIVTNVGDPKDWSSSGYLKAYEEWIRSR